MSGCNTTRSMLLRLCASAWLVGAFALPAHAQAGQVPENPGIGVLVNGFADAPGAAVASVSDDAINGDDIAWREAVAAHRRATAAEIGAAHRAVDLFEKLAIAAPDDALLGAYLGSSLIMKGRDQSFIPARLVSIRQGRARLDAAVAAAPETFDIRLLRVGSTMNLPDLVRDIALIREDLGFLLGAEDALSHEKRAAGDMEVRLHIVLAWACLKQDDVNCARASLAASEGPDLAEGLVAPRAALAEALLR